MKKKRQPKKIIETTKKPHLESGYVRYPGHEIKDISEDRKRDSVLRRDLKPQKNSTYIHTHPIAQQEIPLWWPKWAKKLYESKRSKIEYPNKGDYISEGMVFPSPQDIKIFLDNDNSKAEVIVTRGTKTGKTKGSFIMKKTKKTPRYEGTDNLIKNYRESKIPAFDRKEFYPEDFPKMRNTLMEIANKYHFQIRELNEKGTTVFKYNPHTPNLERKIVISALMFLSSLVLISFKFTGFSIYSISENSLSLLGAALFIISLIFISLSFRKKKLTENL